MGIEKTVRRKASFLIQLCFMIIWITNLQRTDAYFSVYALCCITAVGCLIDNVRHQSEWPLQKNRKIPCAVLSVLFSTAVVLANYPIFCRIRNPDEISLSTSQFLNAFDAVCTAVGGIVICMQIIRFVLRRFPVNPSKTSEPAQRNRPGLVFAGAFVFASLIDGIYLFLVVYPGNASPDSIAQITQCLTGNYVNDHPFWHTMLIKGSLTLGLNIFGEINAAVATYNALQLLMMAACFAFALTTLYQAGVPMLWIYLSAAVYWFLPYNIAYSVTVWKDVLFSGAVLLLVTAGVRIFRRIGKKQQLNYLLLIIGGIGISVLRTNGWISLLISALIMMPLTWKRYKPFAAALLVSLAVGGFLIGPALVLLNIKGLDSIEAMSIPMQQIARVVAGGGELTQEEEILLDKVVDLEKIPGLYDPTTSDPIKAVVRTKAPEFLKANLSSYWKMYCRLGRCYPGEYFKAWIEETKGYWNGGYDCPIYAQYIHSNDLGLVQTRQTNIIHRLVKAYFTFAREDLLFEPIQSIGLHIWLIVLLWFLNLINRQPEHILFIPLFVIVAGLWLCTPIYAAFRYAYPVFTTYPLLLPLTLWGGNAIQEAATEAGDEAAFIV